MIKRPAFFWSPAGVESKWPRVPVPALCLAAVGSLIEPLAADAHPHVFPIVSVTTLFNAQGQLIGTHEKWSFDYDFSAIFKEQADTNKDGRVSEEETAAALADNLSWIPRNNYYTRLTVGGREMPHEKPVGYTARYFAAKLFVEFTLPLAAPADVSRGAGIDVYDPEFYYDFEWAYPDVDVVNGPADCIVDRRQHANIDPVAAMLIRKLGLPADPAIVNDPAVGYAVRVAVTCGAAAETANTGATRSPAPK